MFLVWKVAFDRKYFGGLCKAVYLIFRKQIHGIFHWHSCQLINSFRLICLWSSNLLELKFLIRFMWANERKRKSIHQEGKGQSVSQFDFTIKSNIAFDIKKKKTSFMSRFCYWFYNQLGQQAMNHKLIFHSIFFQLCVFLSAPCASFR